VGTVTATGARVTDLMPGTRIMGLGSGTFGSHVLTSRDLVAAVPAAMDTVDAATIPVAFATAWYALRHVARLRAGQTVLIHSATGGVGLAAVMIARSVGARPHVTAGSEAKRDYLRGLGLSDVYDSRSLATFDEIREAAGSIDVVLNSLPGEAMRRGLNLLTPGGHFMELGRLTPTGTRLSTSACSRQGAR